MKICERKGCKKEHDGTFGSGRFCSRSCANTRIMTPERKLNISKKVKSNISIQQRSNPWKKNPTALERYRKSCKERALKILFEKDFSDLGYSSRRKRVILEQKSKCKVCGIDKWNNKPITLELEHIDGDNKNNNRDNLIALCPNCHSQTKTFRGKNKAKMRFDKYTNEELMCIYQTEGNIYRTLLKIGAAPKGSNYTTLKSRLTLAS